MEEKATRVFIPVVEVDIRLVKNLILERLGEYEEDELEHLIDEFEYVTFACMRELGRLRREGKK